MLDALVTAVRLVALAFMAILGVSVAAGLLSGTINTEGLLLRKGSPRREAASPERIQLLLSTIVSAALYLGQALEMRGSGKLPAPPTAELAAVGLSQAIYLVTKAATFLHAPRR